MAISGGLGRGGAGRRRLPQLLQRHRNLSTRFPTIRFLSSRLTIISLAFIALFPPIFFHLRLRRFHQMQMRKCGWLNNPPLICAHGGDSTNAFPNTMGAYHLALRSRADCIEIDVSRSLDGALFALHDRDLQRISGNNTSKVGYLNMKEVISLVVLKNGSKLLITCTRSNVKLNNIKELYVPHQSAQEFHGQRIPMIEDALKVILDAKVGPPSYEKGLAKDILSVVERAQRKNCLVWAKSDSLARDVIRLSSDVMVGYIVMLDPNTRVRTNLLRIKGAGVIGVYHPLIDEKLVRILHRRNKKVYAWTVDDVDSMQRMLFERVDAVVTSNPSLLQQLMQDIRTQCREEGFSLSR